MEKNVFDNIQKIYYLGPKGSYSELAKNVFVKYFSINPECVPCNSISSVVSLIKNEKDSLAILPLENSIEGVVRESLDKLVELQSNNMKIFAETNISVNHCLIGYSSDKSEIKGISSHPQALAQCRRYIVENFSDDIIQIPVLSTSQGISSIVANDRSQVAIGSEYCANLYDVPIIEKNINDEENNATRFVLLSNLKPYKTPKSKVSVYFSTINKPGALNKVLSVLEKQALNMSQICSRPSRKILGEYVFYIDFEGYLADDNVKKALSEISNYVNELVLLSEGSIII